jgi:hypothetical protein
VLLHKKAFFFIKICCFPYSKKGNSCLDKSGKLHFKLEYDSIHTLQIGNLRFAHLVSLERY